MNEPTGSRSAGPDTRTGLPPRVVVVTGVGRYLGARVAARLATDPRIEQVVGIDSTPPAIPLPGVEFTRADLRTTEIAKILAESGAEAVVHLSLLTGSDGSGRSAMKEHNVIGTMQLLGSCLPARGLRKVVVRSSTAAYGASFRDPAVFTEDTEPREVPRGGFARDVLDIEGYVRGFRRRRPDVCATILRFAPFIGRLANTSLTRYFAQPVVPTVLGRDPRLQFVHVDDVLEVLHRAVVEDHPGTFNVAGPGVLTLSQAVRRAGRIPMPIAEQGLSVSASLARTVSLDQLDLFVHGRVVDITRLIREFGYQPRSTADAFDDFVRGHGEVLPRDAVHAAEQVILAQIRAVRRRMSGVRA